VDRGLEGEYCGLEDEYIGLAADAGEYCGVMGP